VEERERACDEQVLLLGNEPEVYAQGILKICELYLESPLPCVSGVTGSHLKRRIEEIVQNRPALRLNFLKKALLAAAGTAALLAPALLGVLSGSSMRAQGTPPRPGGPVPSFEVASLKPNKGCENAPRGGNFSPSPGRLEMPCVNLLNLIQAAYGTFGDGVSINTTPLHMEGGPSWMRSEYYSLSAKADGPVRTEMLAGPMLQKLLAERFDLQAHRETREMPVYTLTARKGGLKVQPLAEGACTPLDLTHPPAPPKPGDPRPNLCTVMTIGRTANGGTWMEVRGATITQFAQRLSGRVDRTVINKTGVGGMFNFHLEFARDPQMPGQQLPPGPGGDPPNSPLPADSGPNLFTALQEQLGLKLESAKGPVEVLVIDHVDRPTEN
jgi:bla regulator protein blaR1